MGALFNQPNPNMIPNFSAGPYANPATQPPQGIGSVTGGVTAGRLPQGVLDQASQTMTAPAAWGGHFAGALGNQFGQLMSQQGNEANTNMIRQAAPQQANLQLQMEQGRANGGLQNAALLSRLQQDSWAQGQPGRSLLFNLLGQYFQ